MEETYQNVRSVFLNSSPNNKFLFVQLNILRYFLEDVIDNTSDQFVSMDGNVSSTTQVATTTEDYLHINTIYSFSTVLFMFFSIILFPSFPEHSLGETFTHETPLKLFRNFTS